MKVMYKQAIFALGLLLNAGLYGQSWINSWSVQIDGGILYDVYSPAKDQNIIDIPVEDMRSFYSEMDQFNPNINLQVTYAASPIWGWTAGYAVGNITGSNENDFYKASIGSFDAGIKFFSGNLNPQMNASKWSLTPTLLLSHSSFDSELYFKSDNSLQNTETGSAFGHVFGADLGYRVNKNWSFYSSFQHRTVYNDGFDGWDYGSGSDNYVRMNVGVCYLFTDKGTDDVNRSSQNLWSSQTLELIPSINKSFSGNSEELEVAAEKLREEVVASVAQQRIMADSLEMVFEDSLEVLRQKDNRLFEIANRTTVFFDSESAYLKPEMRQELFRFAEQLQTSSWTGTYKIIVTAFTDFYGDESYNASLRAKRAGSVQKYLMDELGVNVTVELETAPHEQLKDHVIDRRVQISVKVLE